MFKYVLRFISESYYEEDIATQQRQELIRQSVNARTGRSILDGKVHLHCLIRLSQVERLSPMAALSRQVEFAINQFSFAVYPDVSTQNRNKADLHRDVMAIIQTAFEKSKQSLSLVKPIEDLSTSNIGVMTPIADSETHTHFVLRPADVEQRSAMDTLDDLILFIMDQFATTMQSESTLLKLNLKDLHRDVMDFIRKAFEKTKNPLPLLGAAENLGASDGSTVASVAPIIWKAPEKSLLAEALEEDHAPEKTKSYERESCQKL